jgi:hypothetical protein
MLLQKRLTLCVAGFVFLSGCAEHTVIRTWPPGAKVTINDKFIGVSPVPFVVEADEPLPAVFHYRLEREGCVTKEGEFPSVVAKGRVVAAVFTLGIVYLFKRPRTIEGRYDFELTPLGDQQRGSDLPSNPAESGSRNLR